MEKDGHGSCWIWLGRTNVSGFPVFNFRMADGKQDVINVRRYMYEFYCADQVKSYTCFYL